GLPILAGMVEQARATGQRSLRGGDVFKLYDTYGFPLDLIAEAAREQDMQLDEAGFQQALEEQRERARKSAGFQAAAARPTLSEIAKRVPPTQFIGYEHLQADGVIQAMLKD